MSKSKTALFACAVSLLSVHHAAAESFFSGDWYVKLGGSGFTAPKYQGDNKNELGVSPIIAIGRQGPSERFSSRNDSAGFGMFDNGAVNGGIAAKLIMPRDEGDADDLRGMSKIKLGGEAGAFANVYPTDWLRVRGEVRQGIRSHSGLVADLSVDAFTDLAEGVQFSAGPRATWVSSKYNDKYYGVTPAQAAAGAPSAYSPSGGLHSAGLGAEVKWKVTEQAEVGSFAEYRRLMGDAGDSSLVRERGSKNQFVVGVQASYKFGFSID
jgi:outer membrane protein